MTNKELELKKSQQYKHLKENVEKVFGTKSDEFISSVMGMILKTIYYSDLDRKITKNKFDKAYQKMGLKEKKS